MQSIILERQILEGKENKRQIVFVFIILLLSFNKLLKWRFFVNKVDNIYKKKENFVFPSKSNSDTFFTV